MIQVGWSETKNVQLIFQPESTCVQVKEMQLQLKPAATLLPPDNCSC